MSESSHLQLYEAIATSAPRTLSGSQGIGLVVTARDTPEKMRNLATGGYPANCDGLPILSMRLVDVDCKWVVFSRIIPDTDYTGRTSFLNHVIAFRRDAIFDIFDAAEMELSPFELALSLPWRKTWDYEHEVPAEIDPKIFDVEKVQRIPLTSFEIASLLAFSNDGGEPPLISPIKAVWLDSNHKSARNFLTRGEKPRVTGICEECDSIHSVVDVRLAEPASTQAYLANSISYARIRANGGPLTHEQIVRRFHQAWMQVNPWRSREPKKNDGRLGEPVISFRDSWGCTFLTQHHTRVRADEFLWIHANREKRPDLERQVVGETENNASVVSAVIQSLGENMVCLLESRAKHPKEWLRGRCELEIRNLNDKLKVDLDEIVKISRENADRLLETLQNPKIDVDKWLAHVLNNSKHWQEIRVLQIEFNNIRDAKTPEMRDRLDKRRELQREVERLSDLAGYESGAYLGAGGYSLPPLLNSEYEKRFHDACLEAEKCCPFLEISEKYEEIKQKDRQIKKEQQTRSDLDKELKQVKSQKQTLLAEKQKLSEEINSLNSQRREAQDKLKSLKSWGIWSLLGVLALLLAALVYYFTVSPFFSSRPDPAVTIIEADSPPQGAVIAQRQAGFRLQDSGNDTVSPPIQTND